MEIKNYSFEKRIGRLRFITYNILLFTLTIPLCNLMPLPSFNNGLWIMNPTLTLIIALSAPFGIQRSFDMDFSAWFYILIIIFPPLFFIYMFTSGTKGDNRYGPPPKPNTVWIYFFGLIVPVSVFFMVAHLLKGF
jgi:uncharacterized membrane protein YhaH (DUF805 family)